MTPRADGADPDIGAGVYPGASQGRPDPGDEVERRTTIGRPTPDTVTEGPGHQVQVGVPERVAAGVDAGPHDGSNPSHTQSTHGVDRSGDDAGSQTTPPGVDHADGGSARIGCPDQDHRRAIGGLHGKGHAGYDSDGSIAGIAGMVTRPFHHDHLGPVLLTQPGPGKRDHLLATALHTERVGSEITVTTVGEAIPGAGSLGNPVQGRYFRNDGTSKSSSPSRSSSKSSSVAKTSRSRG